MAQFDFDLFVIGGGSGGVRAARTAAAKGVRVALCEDRELGGTCVNRGCVPKKLYMYGAMFHDWFEDGKGYGWDVEGATFDWPSLRDARGAELARLEGIYGRLLENSGVTTLVGRGQIQGPNEVKVAGKTYTAERILIATGGVPFVPEISGAEKAITSDDIFTLPELPTEMVLVGAGYIGCEFATIMAGLGVKVHLIVRGDRLLGGYDKEATDFLTEEIQKKGVALYFNAEVTAIEGVGSELSVPLSSGETLTGIGEVMFATGRIPNTENLGLDTTRITLTDRGQIQVNEDYQTQEPSIYAIGDVVGHMQLTPVATREAMVLVDHLYGDDEMGISYSLIPTAIFTRPNLGTVGLSEEEAKQQGFEYRTFTTDFKHMFHTLTGRDERVFMKLVVDTKTDKVLGAHMVGEGAGEIIQGLAVALRAGATKAVFDSTIGIHPTAAEEFVTLRG